MVNGGETKTIYLDNAATSWPKPPDVAQAMVDFLAAPVGSPGRGSHRPALLAGRVIARARAELAAFLGIADPSRLVFTANTTDSLNLAIKGLLQPGDHVIISAMEHNSVTRPLHALNRNGVSFSVVPVSPRGRLDPMDFRRLAQRTTRLIILTHASNVIGAVMPVDEVGRIARELGVLLLVDGAQTTGLLPIDLAHQPVDLLAFPGHKSLLGPPGTGGLYIREGLTLTPLREGGTGTQSDRDEQPLQCPERYEAGTLNAVGIAGLRAGLKHVRERGRESICAHAMDLTARLVEGLRELAPVVRLYLPEPELHQCPVVLFNIPEMDPAQVSFALDRAFGVAARGGLHCAPSAHRVLGTLDTGGGVRLSPGPFTTVEEVEQAVRAVAAVARGGADRVRSST
jgi:cysteine desulfurase family protein